jgi:prepilin signal peptidase PulO-like enzyme (type II secretory pathway)
MLGAAVGSFLNVVIDRTVLGQEWLVGRSRCASCGHQLRWYDLIPIFSYFRLGGKCRDCDEPIPASHPVIEVITGSLFVWWYLVGSLFFRLTQEPLQAIQPLFWLAIGILLLFIFFADWQYYLIPDTAVLGMLLLVSCYRIGLVWLGVMQPIDLLWSGLGATSLVGFFAALWFLTGGRGMGLGDVKFVLPMGLLLGWPNQLLGVMMAFILGATFSLVGLLTKRLKLGQVIPFGPFLVVATCLTLVWGDALVSWYISLL